MLERVIFILPLIILEVSVLGRNDRVKISSDGPIVEGATINFTATVYEGNEISDNNKLIFRWEDNAIPQHIRETDMKNATDSWTVIYDTETYAMGTYIVNVVVKKCLVSLLCYEIASDRGYFKITGTLNGHMKLTQGNIMRDIDFISNTDTVVHEIILKDTDKAYISKAPTVLTYWLVDCTLYGVTTDFKFAFNYMKAEESHVVEALIIADFSPLPTTTVPPTTTTSQPTTTTSKLTSTTRAPSTTTPTSRTTKIRPSVKVDVAEETLRKRRSPDINATITLGNASRIMTMVNGTLVPYNALLPYVCNGTKVATDSKKSYGFFSRSVRVK